MFYITMKIKYVFLCLALLMPLITFASVTIHQQLINLTTKWDTYLSQDNNSITNWNTTVQRFEGNWTKAKIKVDDYFVVSVKNNKWKIIKTHKFKAPYNLATYPNANKWEFPQFFKTIVNISPSNKYMYIQLGWYESSNSYLIRLIDGKVMYEFWSSWRVTRTPNKQRFIVWWYEWMGVVDNLWISKKWDISKYTIIKLNWNTRSIVADNKTVWVYISRYNQTCGWWAWCDDYYINEYNLETGTLTLSTKL